jgi:hypothetical protein
MIILFGNPFRSNIPVRIRTQAAVLVDEHRCGSLIAFEVHISQFDATLANSPPPG